MVTWTTLVCVLESHPCIERVPYGSCTCVSLSGKWSPPAVHRPALAQLAATNTANRARRARGPEMPTVKGAGFGVDKSCTAGAGSVMSTCPRSRQNMVADHIRAKSVRQLLWSLCWGAGLSCLCSPGTLCSCVRLGSPSCVWVSKSHMAQSPQNVVTDQNAAECARKPSTSLARG